MNINEIVVVRIRMNFEHLFEIPVKFIHQTHKNTNFQRISVIQILDRELEKLFYFIYIQQMLTGLRRELNL